MTGFLIYSLFINFEMHLSMNLLEYPLEKSISLKVVAAIFYQFFIFHQMIDLQKL